TDKSGVRPENIKKALPLEPITIGPVTITPFTGLHKEYKSGKWLDGQALTPIESTGYLFQWEDKKLLLLGDTRTYDTKALPDFGPVDILIGHTWLGRGAALEDRPPSLNSFCAFLQALKPAQKIILTHL